MPPRRRSALRFFVLLVSCALRASAARSQAAAPETPQPAPEKPPEQKLTLGLDKTPKRFWLTVSENWHTGFVYDRDDFNTNQFSHPYHGSLYFDAARSNGFNYWESGLFTLAGSAIWECCMENTAPSINDLINTTLGGMTRGEISYRLAT